MNDKDKQIDYLRKAIENLDIHLEEFTDNRTELLKELAPLVSQFQVGDILRCTHKEGKDSFDMRVSSHGTPHGNPLRVTSWTGRSMEPGKEGDSTQANPVFHYIEKVTE